MSRMFWLKMARPIKIPISSNFTLLSKVAPLNQNCLDSSEYVNIVKFGSKSFLVSSQKYSFQIPPSSTPGSSTNFTLSGFFNIIPSRSKWFKVSSIMNSLRISIVKKTWFTSKCAWFKFETKEFTRKESISYFILSLLSSYTIQLFTTGSNIKLYSKIVNYV